MNPGLARLALRRALAPGVLAAWVVLLLLLLPREWAGSNALVEAAGEGADPESVGRGMVRAGVWTMLAIAVLPLLVARAARVVAVWRAGEADWLGSRTTGRGAILASTWIGTWLGGALLLAASCGAIELRAGAGEPTLRRAGRLAIPATGWITARAPLRWTAEDAPAGGRARVEFGFAGDSGSAAEVVFRARRGSSERSSTARSSSRGAVEVELPPGSGRVEFEIACSRPGTRAFLASDAAELWTPCASDRAASAEILLRLVLALATWSALAIGLGAWVSAPTAGIALLAAWIPAWFGNAAAWLPGADLWTALEIAGRGRVPPPIDPRAFAAGAVLAIVGLLLAAAGLRRWRAT